MHRFTQNVKTNVGLMTLSTATSATVSTGTSVDMAKYNNFCGIVNYVVASNTGTTTIYIREGTSAAGAWSTTYLATATLASYATVPYIGGFGTIECRAEQMSDGYRFLRVEVIPAAATGVISITNCRFNSRYPQASLPT